MEALIDRPPASERPVPAGAAQVAPFAASREHAAAVIQLVTRRCSAAVIEHRARGLLDDAHDAMATRLIARMPAHDAVAIAGFAGVLEARVAAAREVGIALALADAFDAWRLAPIDRAIVATLVAARCSPVVARLLGCLGGGVAAVAAVLEAGSDGVMALDARLGRAAPLIRLAIVTVRDPDEAFLARRIEAHPRLAALLAGTVELDDGLAGVRLQRARDPRVEGWAAPAVREELRAAIAGGAALPVIELAASDAGPAVAADVALALAWSALRVAAVGDAAWLDALAREALLHHAVVIVEGEASEALVQRFAALPIPLVVGRARTALPVRRIELALPGVGEREALWRQALGAADHDVDLARLALVVRVGPEAMERAAAHALVAARGRITRDALIAGLLAELPGAPGPSAGVARWDDLVLPGEALDRARDFVAAVKEQRLAAGALGERAALAITGPAGTGKTLLAQVIARELELGLVELAADHPARAAAITAAERGLVLLGFDGDPGGAIRAPILRLSRAPIEGAIALPAPGQDARVRLWRLALAGVAQPADLGLDELARDHALTGAQIRAIGRRAAQLAAASHQPVTRRQLHDLARRTLGGHLA